MLYLTVENTVQEYEKKKYTYILNVKLGSWKYGLFLFSQPHSDPQLPQIKFV